MWMNVSKIHAIFFLRSEAIKEQQLSFKLSQNDFSSCHSPKQPQRFFFFFINNNENQTNERTKKKMFFVIKDRYQCKQYEIEYF